METRYDIQGMTCAHCARSVSDELTGLDGVTAVTVDVDTGTAIVVSTAALAEDDVRAAVDEAGYVLARPGLLPLL
jgi:copper chaperone